jgi:hypothetical protein
MGGVFPKKPSNFFAETLVVDIWRRYSEFRLGVGQLGTITDEVLDPLPKLWGPTVATSKNRRSTFGGGEPILASRISFKKLGHDPDSFVEQLLSI